MMYSISPVFAYGMMLLAAVGCAGMISLYIMLKRCRKKNDELLDLTNHLQLTKDLLTKEIQEAQNELQTKSIFLAKMSHDLRTPMSSIIEFTELALASAVSLKSKEYLEKIKISSAVLMQFINDILDVSKIEAGKMTLEKIAFDIHKVFKVCQTIIAPRAMEKGIVLYCYAEPSVGKYLLGDPVKLQQVLLNLLTNAVKFTNSGIVKLWAFILSSEENSVTIRFEVKDSGIGMTPEQIDRIFELFMQADKHTARLYGGTGLGLPIAKSIVELMGGEIEVESTPGIGSKFSFTLTFATVDIPANVPDDDNVVYKHTKPIFKGEVLLCEDNAMNQQVMCEYLARLGLVTIVADNGRTGVECVKNRIKCGEKLFDLIIMDICMPEMDGLEAAQTLSSLGNKTPIVAMTANIMDRGKELYHRHGMHDVIIKPFNTEELLACLLKYITPIDYVTVGDDSQDDADRKRRNRLLTNFVKDYKNIYSDISSALQAGDRQLSWRLVHTLKSVAGLIGLTSLEETALAAERSLASGITEYTREIIEALGHELKVVLRELEPLIKKPVKAHPAKPFDIKEIISLLNRLELLLITRDSDCLDMLDDLREISGMENLIELIDEYEFAAAHKALVGIRASMLA